MATPRSKWEDEDLDENDIKDSWEEEDEAPKPAPAPIKKVPLAQKIAEREAAEAARKKAIAEKKAEDERLSNETPAERRARLRQIEVEADMKNTVDLFGGVSVSDEPSIPGDDSVITMQPRTRAQFDTYAEKLADVVSKHEISPHFAYFVETFARKLVGPLKDVDVRKVASALTAIANEKQRLEKEKEKGGKKGKGKAKPTLASKSVGRLDTSAYEESLDDGEFDGFM